MIVPTTNQVNLHHYVSELKLICESDSDTMSPFECQSIFISNQSPHKILKTRTQTHREKDNPNYLRTKEERRAGERIGDNGQGLSGKVDMSHYYIDKRQ